MLSINGTDITLTRGNTAELSVLPQNEDGTPYMLAEGDTVLFTVKNRVGRALIQKTADSTEQDAETGELPIILEPADTINLAPQAYTYDVVLVTADGDAYTFIPLSGFTVTTAIGTYQDLGGDSP